MGKSYQGKLVLPLNKFILIGTLLYLFAAQKFLQNGSTLMEVKSMVAVYTKRDYVKLSPQQMVSD
jgi:hypothetical protein